MRFQKEKIKELYLLDTKVENIFINEYLPIASGDHVKVYIYALMFAEHQLPVTMAVISRELGLDEKTVKEAFEFWESVGAVKLRSLEEDLSIMFVNQKNKLYGIIAKDKKEDKQLAELQDNELRELYLLAEDSLGRTISTKEMEDIRDSIEIYGINPDVLSYSFKYCIEIEKRNLNYILKVAKNWNEKGCDDISQVKNLLNEESKKRFIYKKIFERLGFNRNPGPADKAIMDKWINELGYTMDRIIEACDASAGLRNPSLNYVNKVLENWKKTAESKGVDKNIRNEDVASNELLREYLKYVRESKEKDNKEKLEEVYEVLPIIKKLDDNIKELELKFPETLSMGPKGKERREEINSEIRNIKLERAEILDSYGYPKDYTDRKYLCEICKDTGKTEDGGNCSCIGLRREEAMTWIQKKKKPL